jgi:hypothetical protein
MAGLGCAALLALGCADPIFPADADTELSASTGAVGGPVPPDWLIVTSTDFSTGAVSIIETGTRVARTDLALASTDAIPYVHDDHVYVLNRFMFDYIDVLDPTADLALLNQVPINSTSAESTNPHAVAFGPDGLAFVGLYGAPELAIYDLMAPAEDARQDLIDLSALADSDGVPEVDLVWAQGQRIWLAAQRLDRENGWRSVAPDLLVAVDPVSRTLVELSSGEDSGAMELPGRWPKQRRLDPLDEGAAFLLNDGLLRLTGLDGDAPEAEWIVSPAQWAAVAITEPSQPQSFALSSDGTQLFVAAYTQDFSQVRIHRVGRDGAGLMTIVDGLAAVERSLEAVDDVLWFGDTSPSGHGLRAFDLDGRSLGPRLSLGLPPFATATRE